MWESIGEWFSKQGWVNIFQIIGSIASALAAMFAYGQVKAARRQIEETRKALEPGVRVDAYIEDVDRDHFEQTLIHSILLNAKAVPVYVRRSRLFHIRLEEFPHIKEQDLLGLSPLRDERIQTEESERLEGGDVHITKFPIGMLMEKVRETAKERVDGLFRLHFHPVIEEMLNNSDQQSRSVKERQLDRSHTVTMYMERRTSPDPYNYTRSIFSWDLYICTEKITSVEQIRTSAYKRAEWYEFEGGGYAPYFIEGELMAPDVAPFFKETVRLVEEKREDLKQGNVPDKLKQLAEQGDPEAMSYYGWLLLEGRLGLPKNNEGEKWLREAVKLGELNAMYNLGFYLIEGKYLTQDIAEGEKWLRQAAEAGQPNAMRYLGLYLVRGKYLAQDIAEGEKWLRKAAEAGQINAMRYLGRYLVEGKYLAQDIAEGEKWLRKAAEAGQLKAMKNLGFYLVEGKYLTQDIAEGEKWLLKAAEAGHPNAMYNLGMYLLEGKYLAQDLTAGQKWLGEAAAMGQLQAMYHLGVYLLEGTYFKQNITEGEKWLLKAANAGQLDAMRSLGMYLMEGKYLKQDMVAGKKWLLRAEEASV